MKKDDLPCQTYYLANKIDDKKMDAHESYSMTRLQGSNKMSRKEMVGESIPNSVEIFSSLTLVSGTYLGLIFQSANLNRGNFISDP